MLMATPELSIYLVFSFSCAWLPTTFPVLCVFGSGIIKTSHCLGR